MRRLVLYALFALFALVAGCADRAHLYKSTGAATAAAFRAQAGVRGAPAVLGPVDVEILLENYRGAATRSGASVEPPRPPEAAPPLPAREER